MLGTMDTIYIIKPRAKKKQYELVLYVEATIAHYGNNCSKCVTENMKT